MDPSVTWTFFGAHGQSIDLPLGEDSWIRDYYRGAELALAQDTQWDEFIHDGWYKYVMPPPLTGTTILHQPIDPAYRPGLLTVQRFFAFLPTVLR
jgi:hypothetical protein